MTNVTMSTHTGKESSHYKREGIKAGNGGVENKKEKVLVIANTNTVVDPGAVV
jgi:hypothetical protein